MEQLDLSAAQSRGEESTRTRAHILIESRAVVYGATAIEIANLRAMATMPDWPAIRAAERMGRPTAHIRPISAYSMITPHRISLPRGLARRAAEYLGLPFGPMPRAETMGRAEWIINLSHDLPMSSDLGLRGYQVRALCATIGQPLGGVICAPCGAGKTTIGCALIAQHRVPALIVVHSHDLARQWRERILELLRVDALIIAGSDAYERVRDGRSTPIMIVMAQTLAAQPLARVVSLGSDYGMVILDEAHHVPASTFARVIDAMPCAWRYGLTATPDREDGLAPLIEWYLGPTIATVSRDELVADGHLLLPELHTLRTEFSYDYADDYAAMMQALAQDDARWATVSTRVCMELMAGRSVLVLAGQVDVAQRLVAVIRASSDLEVEALHARIPKRERVRILDDARAGKVRCIVATSLADEGLDWPSLDTVVLAWPSKAAGRIVQRIGRVMRPAPGKTAGVIDVVDAGQPVLRAQWYRRRRVISRDLGI